MSDAGDDECIAMASTVVQTRYRAGWIVISEHGLQSHSFLRLENSLVEYLLGLDSRTLSSPGYLSITAVTSSHLIGDTQEI